MKRSDHCRRPGRLSRPESPGGIGKETATQKNADAAAEALP